MFVNTHTLIAKSIVNNIDENKHFFLNENHFIYGNIKPDLSSKYFFNTDKSVDGTPLSLYSITSDSIVISTSLHILLFSFIHSTFFNSKLDW